MKFELLKKRITLTFTLTFVFCITYLHTGFAQKTDTTNHSKKGMYRLVTKDGNVFYGKIVKSTKEHLIFETKDLGTITVPLRKVAKIELAKKNGTIPNKKQWYDNRMDNYKYFITTTGFNLRKHDFYLEDTYLFLVGGRYGINDWLSVGGGLSFLPGVSLEEQLYFFSPKVTFSVAKNLRIGASFNWLNVPAEGGFGLLNFVATYGSPKYNFTAGLSYIVFDGQTAQAPLVSIGTMLRPLRKVAFIGELLLLPTQVSTQLTNNFVPIALGGVRLMYRKSSFDLGLTYLAVDQMSASAQLVIPYLSYRYQIN